MNTGLLMAFIFYITNFLLLGGMCSYAVAKKRWIFLEKNRDPTFAKYVAAHPEKIGVVRRVMKAFLLVVIGLCLYCTARYTLDVPYILRNEYIHVRGIAQSRSTGGKGGTDLRPINVLDEFTGEEIHIEVYSERIPQGTYIDAYVLPHTKIGIRVDD